MGRTAGFTELELEKSIQKMKNGKAPGIDGIAIKIDKESASRNEERITGNNERMSKIWSNSESVENS